MSPASRLGEARKNILENGLLAREPRQRSRGPGALIASRAPIPAGHHGSAVDGAPVHRSPAPGAAIRGAS